MDQPQPLFGLLPAGQPLITTPTSQPGQTSFLYAIPHSTPTNPKPFAHLAVFLLPDVSLPPNIAAAIYVAQNPSALATPAPTGASPPPPPNFRFLGGVGPGKESAVFKLTPGGSNSSSSSDGAPGSDGGGVVIGIELEDAGAVAERIRALQQEQQGDATNQQLVLAQRIIQNAFNFLSGFSGHVGAGGTEVVPLKAFQDWWRKFENRIRNDHAFLERGQD
ncbi:hypothetical protein F4779DRAFT_110402 [Xylariaceae sp. FL0662B]|nr:hypothetical protein F4779DRAFT_110402 [Xylariaceae sp. FL0662B]